MRTGLAVTLTFFVAAATLQAAPAGVRSLFLNGVDISSARGQDLRASTSISMMLVTSSSSRRTTR